MTREQAIEVLIDRYNSGVIRGRTDDEWRLATDTVIAALRGPQPDPDTGLVPCGCGGKAGFHYSVIVDNDCYVECGICGEHTKVAPSEEKARDAWNTAMGWKGGAECGKIRIDIPPGNDSVRASPGLQRDGGDKTERWCNQCVICGQEMSEGDQVCGYCRRQHGY